LRAGGSPGVHLGVRSSNTHARAFYDHLGFSPLATNEWGTIMGMSFRRTG
jgi:ribosomal protein S18 acetylase RimI-like enzyme